MPKSTPSLPQSSSLPPCPPVTPVPPTGTSPRWPQDGAGVAERIAGLRGWSRLTVATAAGALSVLSMAPFYLWLVLFVTLPVLVWLLEGARLGPRPRLSCAVVGWCFAWGYHVFGLYWLREAFAVTAGTLELLWPLAVLGLPAYLALFSGGATLAVSQVPGSALRRTVALALALSVSEWLRGHAFTGFPWNTLGYALTWPMPLMQSASVIGIYGLTLVTVLVCAGPAVMLATPKPTARRWGQALAVALVPLAVMTGYGVWRLAASPPAMVEGVKLRLVQPSIPQRAKWQSERQLEFFGRHLELSDRSQTNVPDHMAGITHVLWPEAAMPFQPLRYPHILGQIGAALPTGTILLAGILRTESITPPPGAPPSPPVDAPSLMAYNSVAAFDATGTPIAIYDKIHLVPFGEYLPFQATLESFGLQSLTRQRGGFTIGATPRPMMAIPGLPPAGILICYEAVFPAAVVQGRERPGVLLNLTNDGWFGDSTGPRQHAHQARMRAVEEGIPLIRVANNGISAVYDAYGRELVRIGLDVTAVADTGLPGALAPTPYARLGDGAALLLWLAALAVLLLFKM